VFDLPVEVGSQVMGIWKDIAKLLGFFLVVVLVCLIIISMFVPGVQ